MGNKKRTRSGQIKAPDAQNDILQSNQDVAMIDITPQHTEAQPQASKPTERDSTQTPQTQSSNPTQPKNKHHPKLPKLPKNTNISKRPLLHPPIPTPYSSPLSPKTLYITPSSPLVPSLKRIRSLLSQMRKRSAQAQATKAKRRKPIAANGRLKNAHVERAIADEAASARVGDTDAHGEKVYLRASGRAIARALEIGVRMQEEGDCVVRVEMGSVKAIDDVEVTEGGEGEEGVCGQDGEDVPETRIRTISSVTVSIGIK